MGSRRVSGRIEEIIIHLLECATSYMDSAFDKEGAFPIRVAEYSIKSSQYSECIINSNTIQRTTGGPSLLKHVLIDIRETVKNSVTQLSVSEIFYDRIRNVVSIGR